MGHFKVIENIRTVIIIGNTHRIMFVVVMNSVIFTKFRSYLFGHVNKPQNVLQQNFLSLLATFILRVLLISLF